MVKVIISSFCCLSRNFFGKNIGSIISPPNFGFEECSLWGNQEDKYKWK